MKGKGKIGGFFRQWKEDKSTSTHMSVKEIWSYGLTDFGRGGSTQMISSTSYVNMFMVMALGVDVAAFGILMTVSSIIGYIQGPIISLMEDSTKSKWGRFRPYVIVTAPLTAALAIMFFLNPFGSGSKSALVWIYATYILYGISSGFCTTAWNGITKCITQNPKEREKAFSISKALGIIATTVPSMFPIMIDYGPKFGISIRTIFVAMTIFLGSISILGLVTAKNLTERVMIRHAEKPWKNIGMVFKNKNKMLTWINSLGSFFSYLSTIATPYVIMYCYGAYSLQTFIWGFAGVFAWLGLFMSKKIFNRFSAKHVVIIYNCMTIIANLIILVTGYGTSVWLIFALFGTRCFAAVFEYVASVASSMFETDIWDHFEWQYGIRNESTTDLVGGWVTAPISILNPLIYAWVFKAIGFRSGDAVVQSDTTIRWIFYIFIIGSVVSTFFSTLPFIIIQLNKKTMTKVHKELEERRLAREGMTQAMALAAAAGGTVSGDFVEPAPEYVEAAATEDEAPSVE